jgi:hypothetical protein
MKLQKLDTTLCETLMKTNMLLWGQQICTWGTNSYCVSLIWKLVVWITYSFAKQFQKKLE